MEIKVIPVGIIQTNCYIVTDSETGETLVVDPGDKDERVLDFVKDKNVKYILLTHGHYDHILGVKELKDKTGASVLIHESDAICLEDENISRSGLHFPGHQEPMKADKILSDGDIIPFGGTEITVMSTPGHTPGSVCYILKNEGAIFSGDTLFYLSIGRTDFVGGSMEEMRKSLKKLGALEGNFSVFPGHGESTDLDFEKKRNPYLK